MSQIRHRVTITEISTASEDGSPVIEREVFRQEFTELNSGKMIQQLNATPRRSKSKTKASKE